MLDASAVAELAVWYLVFVFSTTCHEAAHAWVAYRGGDLTAYSLGHVSLDPTPHIKRSPFGMVVVPVASFLLSWSAAGGGWMIGWASVPVNRRWAADHPRRAALMSLAGPSANLLLALAAFAAMRALLAGGVVEVTAPYAGLGDLVHVPDGSDARSPLGALSMALSVTLSLNVILGLFNLIPLPPLDGAAALEGALPRASARFYDRLREVPAFELLGLLVAWKVFPYVAWPALDWVRGWLSV